MSEHPLKLRVASLDFRSRDIVDTDSAALVTIIGPNNVGKSTLLREILAGLSRASADGVLLSNVEIDQRGTVDELWRWVGAEYVEEVNKYGVDKKYVARRGDLRDRDFQSWIKAPLSSDLVREMVRHITYESRMSAVQDAKAFDAIDGRADHPFHSLVRNPEFLAYISGLAAQAFNIEILLDRGMGDHIRAYCVGENSDPPTLNEVAIEYLRWLRAHARLSDQGDGIRSYVGCLLELFATPSLVTLLDEPEVFLHPPQAKLLGRTLARERLTHEQLFVATHSVDVLKGILEAGAESTLVIRLSRSESATSARVLDAAAIAKIWRDPSLQYSNVLDALFHDGAVVCEADADCRFYQWLAAANLGGRRDDIMFIPTGGKSRAAVVLAALREIGVPSIAILDADALRDKQELRKLVQAAGGNWETISSLWMRLSAVVMALGASVSKEEAMTSIRKALNETDGKYLTERDVEKARKFLQVETGWALLKRSGFAAIPNGEPTQVAEAIRKELSDLGIFLVPAGEMEGFVRERGGKGAAWVASVMETYDARAVELQDVVRFVDSALHDIQVHVSAAPRPTPPVRPARVLRKGMRSVLLTGRKSVPYGIIVIGGIFLVWLGMQLGKLNARSESAQSPPGGTSDIRRSDR